MIDAIEKSVFLRSLNYLRVRHRFALRYNWIYPAVFCSLLSYSVIEFANVSTTFAVGGLIKSFVPVLSILAPFYIAALAAVSTFRGKEAVDKKFEMSEPVLLKVIGDGGEWEKIDVTPRHFLSLLFGYCAALSIFVLTFALFSEFVPKVFVGFLDCWKNYFLGILVIGFLFLFSQLVLATLLGIYFLADKLHR